MSTKKHQKSIRILLIEDDEEDYILLKALVGKINHHTYKIIWKSTYEEGMKLVEHCTEDVICVDYRLGEKNGIDFIKHAQKKQCDKPIILLTSLEDEDLGLKALREGAQDYLIKGGITPNIFERSLRYAIERKEVFVKQQQIAAWEAEQSEYQRQRKRMYELFMEAPAAIAVLEGKKMVFELFNTQFLAFCGRKAKDLNGQKAKDAIPEFSNQGLCKIFDEVLRTGKTFLAHEYSIKVDKHGDGKMEQGYFNFIAKPFLDKNGKVDRIFLHIVDVSDEVLAREKIMESENKLRRIVDSNIVGIIFYSAEGMVTYANEAFLQMIGYSQTELAKKQISLMALTPQEFRTKDEASMKELRQKGICNPYEKDFFRKDGSRVQVLVGAAAFANGDNSGVAFILDISERKRLEKQKDEFIGIASHELKTPVTSIKGFAQILATYFKNQPKALYYLSRMDDQVNRLTELINDLLDVSRIESGKLDLNKEKVELNSLIGEIVTDIQPTDLHHTITFQHNGAIEIYADKYRLSQVVINLLTNAIKYSPKADSIIVKTKKNHSSIQILVQDFGIGIAPKNITRIFEPFYQADTKVRQSFGGLGLGLHISREIIKRHGGNIQVKSSKGRGSVFSIHLPINPE